MTYTKIGEVSEECRQFLFDALPVFHLNGGKPKYDHEYYSTPRQKPLDTIRHPELEAIIPWDRWWAAFAVQVRPGGNLHNHTHDLDRDQGKTRYHVVLETNDKSESWNGGQKYHLKLDGVYRMEPYLPHEAWNHGESPRTHLILVTDNV